MPASTHTAPDTSAIMAASATARRGSPPESGSTTPRIRATRAESGPRTSTLLGPKSA